MSQMRRTTDDKGPMIGEATPWLRLRGKSTGYPFWRDSLRRMPGINSDAWACDGILRKFCSIPKAAKAIRGVVVARPGPGVFKLTPDDYNPSWLKVDTHSQFVLWNLREWVRKVQRDAPHVYVIVEWR